MAKAFSWSYSRLKNFETCPKRYYEVDQAKNFKDDTAQLDWGNAVHAAMAHAITTGKPLPPGMEPFQKWVNSLAKFRGEKLVEQKWALNKDFQPTEWFSPSAWVRSVGDFVGIAAPKALSLDWKTGKPQQDSKQLMLVAACVFAFHPDVHEIDSGFVWLKHDTSTVETYRREDMAQQWLELIPRVKTFEQAVASMSFPPKPDRLCKKYCPVASCPFWKKGPQG